MRDCKRIFTLLTAILMMTASFPVLLTGVISIHADEGGAADTPVKINAYTREAPNRAAKQVPEGSVYGHRMHYNAPFDGVEVSVPTWNSADAAITLSIYKWQGSVDDTVKSTPITSEVFDPATDNAFNLLRFDEQPAGEYFVTVSDVRGKAGVWQNDAVVGKGFAYMDGSETPVDWEMRVYFTTTPEEPFLPCKSIHYTDGTHTAPPRYEIPEDSLINTHPVMPDTWVFTDGLGRVSLTNADVGDPREDRTLAMFYWSWHGNRIGYDYVNVQEMLEKYPEAINDYDHPCWPTKTSGIQYFWNEPIYGYYVSQDEWVTRRQSELMANAGVDVVFADNTNWADPRFKACLPIFESWNNAMEDGVKTPKFSFMLPFGDKANTHSQLLELYNGLYRNDDYHNLWFYWSDRTGDKPLLMALGGESGVMNTSDPLEREIKNFFAWRSPYASYLPGAPEKTYGKWGWLATYPQAVYYANKKEHKEETPEQISVGVAMNHNYELGALAAMNGGKIMGRSFTSTFKDRYEKEGAEASKWGYNFAEQFGYALEIDPKVIFVTGWNEWNAGRYETWPEDQESAVENAFPDQCNDEYSRDIEPTKGALKDHYYYQLVNFVRQYKGVRPIPTPGDKVTIDITGDNTQWSAAEPYYAAYIGNTDDRDSVAYGDLRYTEYSGRNDIKGARVARDDEFIYFYVECVEDITPYTDPLWMVLYIDSDQKNQGWETFDYVLNKTSPTAEKATLEKFTGNGYETEKVGEVDYTVTGKYMQVKVPKTMLGLEGDGFTINFSWTDNVHDEDDAAPAGDTEYKYTKYSGDIMDFYISGDVAPGGRFKFSYVVAAEGGDTSETETSTEAFTEIPTEPSATPTDTPDTNTEGGCKSSVAAGAAAMVLAAAAAAVALKKKED